MEHLAYQNGELLVVEEMYYIRSREGKTEIPVHWKCFESSEDDWIDIKLLSEDVPKLLLEFVSDLLYEGTPRQKRIARFL